MLAGNYVFFVFIVLLFSCANNSQVKTNKNHISCDNISIIKPQNTNRYLSGDKILLDIENTGENVDSIVLYINNKRIKNLENTMSDTIETANFPVGSLYIKLKSYYSNSSVENDDVKVILNSDINPQIGEWTVKRKIKHDITSYTQGLFLYNDTLFESTGQWGQSKLRKINPENGEVYLSKDIDAKYFGEGITIANGLVFHITYKAGLAFIYEKENFEIKHSIRYSNVEGWGLTTDSSGYIIMSEGSEKLYFRNPSDFSITRVVEVYDNKGPVYRLNELEYVNGKVWANIYGSDKIAVIDPVNGKVHKYFNMKGLLKDEDRHPSIDVLNGIAFDESTGQVILTGKNWPYIYFCVTKPKQ
jgi:glutamine cyclotransferase